MNGTEKIQNREETNTPPAGKLTSEQIGQLTSTLCGDYDLETCEAILLLMDAIENDRAGSVVFEVKRQAFSYLDEPRDAHIRRYMLSIAPDFSSAAPPDVHPSGL